MITSAQNQKIKLVRTLVGRPRDRRKENAFFVEGARLVEEALAAGWPFRFALYAETLSERGQELVSQLAEAKVELDQVLDPLMESISETETSQGILAVLEMPAFDLPEELDFVLVADTIRDPGNLGTLMRTAAAAGVQAVFLPPETVDAYSPKVVRAGMGAHFRLPVYHLSWDEIRARLKGLFVYLADAGAQVTCWECDLRSPLAIIIGGEAQGASNPARTLAHKLVSIPMPGQSESLNAGVAGAVLMFEVVRQRSQNKA